MSVLVVGLSHRSAPVSILERAAVGPPEIPKLLDEILRTAHVSEVVLLSTCNRIEVYAVVDAFHGGLDDISGVLARHAGTPLADHLYVHYAGAAVQHLFAVASGLDSMVVGEAQILGQLRAAYAAADEAGTVGRILHELAQQSLRVGKRVHADTGIDRAGASVVSEALADAATALGGDLVDRRAVVVGAGAMGGLAAAHLRRAGAAEIVVINRSRRRAEALVATVTAAGAAARVASFGELGAELVIADVMVACTGSVGTVVERETVEAAVRARSGRLLAVCDLGLPRDVDAGVAGLAGVTVVDLAGLARRLADGARGHAVAAAAELVAQETQAYLSAQRSAEVTPTVTALRRRASEVVDAELLRLSARLPDLDDDVHAELTRTVRRVVDKLLHTPTVQVKKLADGPDGGSYAEALRALFELDPQSAAAVAAARGGVVVPPPGSGAVIAALEVGAEPAAIDRAEPHGAPPPEEPAGEGASR